MDDSDSEEPRKPARRRGAVPMLSRPRGSGFAAEGPGFYVWDEDPNEVIRAVRELQRGNQGVRPTHRMLIVQTGPRGARLAGATAEVLDL